MQDLRLDSTRGVERIASHCNCADRMPIEIATLPSHEDIARACYPPDAFKARDGRTITRREYLATVRLGIRKASLGWLEDEKPFVNGVLGALFSW